MSAAEGTTYIHIFNCEVYWAQCFAK